MPRVLALAPALLLAAAALAKPLPPDHPDHANHYQSGAITSNDVTLTSPVAWARQAQGKVKIKFDNDSTRWLLVHKNGIEFTTGGNTFQPTPIDDRYEVVRPNDEGAHTFVFADEANHALHGDTMSLGVIGAFLATEPKPVNAPDTYLPARSDGVEEGGFTCRIKGKVTQSTDKLLAKYECTFYAQPGTIGFVDAAGLRVSIDAGEFANEAGGQVELMMPGQTRTIKLLVTSIQPRPHGVDMQFTELPVKWDTALFTSTLERLEMEPWAFELDPATTAAKND